jgi:hypothetical protein
MTVIEIFSENVPVPILTPLEYYQRMRDDAEVVTNLIHPAVPQDLNASLRQLVLKTLAESK